MSEMEDSSAWEDADPVWLSDAEFIWSDSDGQIEFELPIGQSVFVHAVGFDLYSDWEESDGCYFEVGSDYEDHLKVLGVVDPYQNSDDDWLCGALVAVTSDTEVDEELEGVLGADYRAFSLDVTITTTADAVQLDTMMHAHNYADVQFAVNSGDVCEGGEVIHVGELGSFSVLFSYNDNQLERLDEEDATKAFFLQDGMMMNMNHPFPRIH